MKKDRISWHKRWTLRLAGRLSVPPVWYEVILGIGIVFCVLATVCPENGLLIGLGSGTVASLIVALLMDLGGTGRKNKSDRAQFARLQDDLKTACRMFPSTLGSFARAWNEDREKDVPLFLEEAYVRAAGSDPEGVERLLLDIAGKARDLIGYANILSANPCFDEEYMVHLADLAFVCGFIGKVFSGIRRGWHMLTEEIDWIKRTVCGLYPEVLEEYETELGG